MQESSKENHSDVHAEDILVGDHIYKALTHLVWNKDILYLIRQDWETGKFFNIFHFKPKRDYFYDAQTVYNHYKNIYEQQKDFN